MDIENCFDAPPHQRSLYWLQMDFERHTGQKKKKKNSSFCGDERWLLGTRHKELDMFILFKQKCSEMKQFIKVIGK